MTKVINKKVDIESEKLKKTKKMIAEQKKEVNVESRKYVTFKFTVQRFYVAFKL